MQRAVDHLLVQEVRGLLEPEPDIFWRVAEVGAWSQGRDWDRRYESMLRQAAWTEAAHMLLGAAHRRDGCMSGSLPDGSAHVRIMLESESGRHRAVDVYRADGRLPLALLEAILLGWLERKGHAH